MKKSLLVMAVCLLSFAFTACSPASEPSTQNKETDSKESSTSKETPETKDESSDKSTTEEKDESTKENTPEEEKKLEIGETSTLQDWEIKVTDMKVVDSIDSSKYSSFSPDEGNKYIQVFVSVTNKGKTSDTFLPSYGFGDDISTKLLYGDGYEFTSTVLLGYDKDLHDSNLNPLASAKKQVVFSVPESVSSSKDELLVVFSGEEESITYKIR